MNADLELGGAEQKRQRFAQRFIVIDDVNHRLIEHQLLPQRRPPTVGRDGFYSRRDAPLADVGAGSSARKGAATARPGRPIRG